MKTNILKILILGTFFTLFCDTNMGLDISRMRIAHPSGSGEMFHGGVYIYSDNTPSDTMMENHIRMMTQQGLTHLYLIPQGDMTSDKIIPWCRKYRCYVSFQHNYFTGTETSSQLASKAVSAAAYIGSLWNEPEYLTSSVREEPPDDQTFIDGLFSYYDMINGNLGGTAPLYLLHNYPGPAAKAYQESFKPIMTGYDRTYLYDWIYNVTVNGNLGYLISPRDALSLIDTYLREFVPYYDPSCQWSVAVLSGWSCQRIDTKTYLADTYGSTAFQRWLSLSQYNNGEGNQGLKESGDNILSWRMYMPPQNCMSCQTWLAVARGYRATFVYYCRPQFSSTIGLMGADGKGTAQLNEYAGTVRELQKFGWVINHMEYQPSEAYISYTDSPQYTIYSGSFTVPAYSGKIAVLVNADVATWSNTSPLYFNDSHVFRFDNNGFVKTSDYTAKTTSRSIAITNNVAGTSMYDLESGTFIGGTSGSIDILPGKGEFIFIGSQAELDSIRAKCGMTTITAHSGLIPNRETIPTNIQIFYAIDPKISNSLYQLSTTTISWNKRYRLHVTAKSSDGAQLGALPGYYNGSWHTYHINLIDNSDFWNKTLNSTPTEFVSKDFTVSSGTQAAVFLWRSNQQGSIQIDDAWVEDCDSHRQIDTEWMDNSITYPVNNGETYQVYARARNYPCYNSKLSIKIYEYNSSDTLLGYYDTASAAIIDQTLTGQPTVFQGTFQKNNSSAHHVRIKFIKSSGDAGPVILESACVGKIIP